MRRSFFQSNSIIEQVREKLTQAFRITLEQLPEINNAFQEILHHEPEQFELPSIYAEGNKWGEDRFADFWSTFGNVLREGENLENLLEQAYPGHSSERLDSILLPSLRVAVLESNGPELRPS